MTDGDLIDFLDKVKNESLAYTEADAASIVHQLLMAVNYIHSTGIAHRDLKLDNILVKLSSQQESDSFALPSVVCKLTDFGLVTLIEKEGLRSSSLVGTPMYMSPELISGNDQYDAYASDIWAIGVIAYVLLTVNFPFGAHEHSKQGVFKSVMTGKVNWRPLGKYKNSGAITDFIKLCFKRDCGDRPRARELMNHPWLVDSLAAAVNKGQKSATEKKQSRIEKVEAIENISKFKEVSEFQRGVVAFLIGMDAKHSDQATLRELFLEMDTNQDGYVSRAELVAYLTTGNACTNNFGDYFKCLLQKGEEVQKTTRVTAIFDQLDSDKSGWVDYQEFVNKATKVADLLTEDNLRVAFAILDKNEDGVITAEELRHCFSHGRSSFRLN